ncbi:Hsp70 family protein [Dactylosporangium sp. NPDC051541]|uniref:Hsp70 family protein n=1 Tax=Dactylosporangium sp. NPDC051541 TaxID=3363977 RepID=UPI0037B7B4FA
MSTAFGLGIDFGTSNTVALMRWPDGRVRPLLFDASPLLPSAVFATAGGALVVGGDALHHARFDPAALASNPKQHIDELTVLLGAREVDVTELFAAVLRHVAAEARRVAGDGPITAAVTHPAAWAASRRQVLAAAAAAAGLNDLGGGPVRYVTEPVAAGHSFTTMLDRPASPGRALVVYDLGAGTFDAAVLVRDGAGFTVAGTDGLPDVGGLDIDAAVVRWIGERHAPQDPALWSRLTDGQDDDALRQRRMLWNDAKVAKEMLSRAPAVVLHMPAPLHVDAQLTRDEFEALAKPLVERTVQTTAALIHRCGLSHGDVHGIVLVGGGSRIPLVATMLHRSLGIAPTVTEQPEIVVAEGALGSLQRPSPPKTPPAPSSPRPAAASGPSSASWPTPAPGAASTPGPAPTTHGRAAPDRTRGRLYQTGQYPVVEPSPPAPEPTPPSQPSQPSQPSSPLPHVPPRYVPPPAGGPVAPPVADAAATGRVKPVWTPNPEPPPQRERTADHRPPNTSTSRTSTSRTSTSRTKAPRSPVPSSLPARVGRGLRRKAVNAGVVGLAILAGALAAYVVAQRIDVNLPPPGESRAAASSTAGTAVTVTAVPDGAAESPVISKTTKGADKPVTVSVPGVVGLSEQDAKRKIEANGLVAEIDYSRTDGSNRAWVVLSTSPGAGEPIAKGGTVTVRMGPAAGVTTSPSVHEDVEASPTCRPPKIIVAGQCLGA